MDMITIAQIGRTPNLEILVSELCAVDGELSRTWSSGGVAEHQAAYARHWELRETINATPARTAGALLAKRQAFEIALALDEDFECHTLAPRANWRGPSLRTRWS